MVTSRILISHFFKIHFSIPFTHTTRSLKYFLPVRFSSQNFVRIYSVSQFPSPFLSFSLMFMYINFVKYRPSVLLWAVQFSPSAPWESRVNSEYNFFNFETYRVTSFGMLQYEITTTPAFITLKSGTFSRKIEAPSISTT